MIILECISSFKDVLHKFFNSPNSPTIPSNSKITGKNANVKQANGNKQNSQENRKVIRGITQTAVEVDGEYERECFKKSWIFIFRILMTRKTL